MVNGEGKISPDFDKVKIAGANLKSWHWRINNLYYITNKDGVKVKFKMNRAQRVFFKNMHYRNIILKARQLGMTTFVMIFMLDAALFRKNTRCAVIAHTKPDAQRLFDEKIKFAYDNLPPAIKRLRPTVADAAGVLKLSNGSSITVGTSFRGGTLRYLHISEFGKICAKSPDKAKEIVTGAFEAVGSKCMITLESTAEGRTGYFFDYCQRAENDMLIDKALSRLDWKFFFFSWFEDPEYTLDEGDDLTKETIEYFEKITAQYGISFTVGQMRWYQAKAKDLGDDMKREYPTIPKEAFEVSIEGAYYTTQFKELYKNKQITRVPHEPAAAVHTIWDIGVNDKNAIWFVQLCGREWHIINYYENSGEGVSFYIKILKDYQFKYGYTYGTHIGPHDLEVREWGNDGMTRKDSAKAKGIEFSVAPKLGKTEGIDIVRNVLPLCWFDEANCAEGIAHLQNYRKEWDEKAGTWKQNPLHDDSSNGSDSFRYFATSTNLIKRGFSFVTVGAVQKVIHPAAWT
ncbi:hypothetical protein K1B37_000980 [Vibrio parahaemolyticus]|nr:hypothetical protein [Vibrio parahaemolyticus]